MTHLRRLLLPALLATAAAAAACSEIGTDPDSAVSIDFDTLPALAIVQGDTLRDSLGRTAPITATAFNAAGGVIANAPFTFLARDTSNALIVDPAGKFVVARDGTVGTADVTLQASLGSLQFTRTLAIVPRPDSLGGPTKPVEVKLILAPDTAALRGKNLSNSFTVRVLHDTTTTTRDFTPVRSWLVRFAVDSMSTQFLDSARLVDASGVFRSSAITGADGGATLQLRVYPKMGSENGVTRDTIFVRASALRREGEEIEGSPVTIKVPVGICTGPTSGCLTPVAPDRF